MAIYRQIYMSFWTDTKIDDFSPEDKYFYLYLMTNPHTSLSGCYEISIKQMAYETGYNEATVIKLINRLMKYNVAYYEPSTKEVLLLNWYKHNWTCSKDLIKSIKNEVNSIKNDDFREYVNKCLCYKENDTLPTPSIDGGETTVTVTVTDTVNSYKDINKDNSKKKDKTKHKYGEYQNVLLTDDELEKLKNAFPDYEARIKELDEGIELKGYKYKSHYLAILKWSKNGVREKETFKNTPPSYDSEAMKRKAQSPENYIYKPKNRVAGDTGHPSYDIEAYERKVKEEPIVYKRKERV